MPKLKHNHTYQRVKKTPTLVYRCIHPDCSHFAKAEFILGKRAACVCGALFILDKYNLKLKNPHCERCNRNFSKKQRELEEISEIISPSYEFGRPELQRPPSVTIRAAGKEREG